MVIQAQSVDEKNRILCEGIYNYFAGKYGVKNAPSVSRPGPKKSRKHNRPLKKVIQERNGARRDARQAKKKGRDDTLIRDLPRKLYKLVRTHSKAKRKMLNARMNLEARKARRDCAKHFWLFASRVLDGKGDPVESSFSAEDAVSFFSEFYSSSPRQFHRPEWLPEMHAPS